MDEAGQPEIIKAGRLPGHLPEGVGAIKILTDILILH